MTQKRPRVGVVGSSNVDVVTYIERMRVRGETLAAPVPLAAVLDFSAADLRRRTETTESIQTTRDCHCEERPSGRRARGDEAIHAAAATCGMDCFAFGSQ